MYDAIGLTSRIIEQLTALEQELQRPIRVLAGGAYSRYLDNNLPEWTTGFLGDNPLGITADDAEVRGITIASWATAAETVDNHSTVNWWPAELYTDGERHRREAYDQLYVTEEPDGFECYRFGEDDTEIRRNPFRVEVGERLVIYNFSIEQARVPDLLAFDHVFGDPVRMSAEPEFLSRLDEIRAQRDRERWERWARNARNRQLDTIRTEIETFEQRQGAAVEQLATAIGRLRDLRVQAEVAEAAMLRDGAGWQELYTELERHPRITGVRFNSRNQLVLTTDMITMQHPAHGTRTLGRIEIAVALEGERYLRFKNLDFPRNGRPHPHIASDGHACFAEFGPQIAQFLGQLELIGLVEMLIMFLESFNERDDWGRFAALWYDEPDALEAQQDTADDEAEELVEA